MKVFTIDNVEYKFYGDNICGLITANDDRVLIVGDGGWENIHEEGHYKSLKPETASFVIGLFEAMD